MRLSYEKESQPLLSGGLLRRKKMKGKATRSDNLRMTKSDMHVWDTYMPASSDISLPVESAVSATIGTRLIFATKSEQNTKGTLHVYLWYALYGMHVQRRVCVRACM